MSWGDRWRSVLNAEDLAAAQTRELTGREASRQADELRRRVRQGAATYRSGRVSDIRMGAGRVAARVQGSRATPFLVELGVPVFTDAEWEVLLELLSGTVRYSARLLANQAPEGLEAAAAEQGVQLFPTIDQIAVAAGHSGEDPFPVVGAAVWEAVATRLDDSPFPLLQIRGRGRERVLRDVARRRRADDDGPAAGVDPTTLSPIGWTSASRPLGAISLPAPTLPSVTLPALRVLGEPDGWAGALSPADLLGPIVDDGAVAARQLLLAEDEGE